MEGYRHWRMQYVDVTSYSKPVLLNNTMNNTLGGSRILSFIPFSGWLGDSWGRRQALECTSTSLGTSGVSTTGAMSHGHSKYPFSWAQGDFLPNLIWSQEEKPVCHLRPSYISTVSWSRLEIKGWEFGVFVLWPDFTTIPLRFVVSPGFAAKVKVVIEKDKDALQNTYFSHIFTNHCFEIQVKGNTIGGRLNLTGYFDVKHV